MFMSDFASNAYEKEPFYKEALRLYAPMKGEMGRKILEITKEFTKIVAILGGQWPHTSSVVPGGVTTIINPLELIEVRTILARGRLFLEEEIYGASLEQIVASKKFDDLPKHKELKRFIEYAFAIGLERMGEVGYEFLSFGGFEGAKGYRLPAGTSDGVELEIVEDSTYSYYKSEIDSPFFTSTKPSTQKPSAYSYTKAPRIGEKVYQVGALGEMVIAKEPLFLDILERFGDGAFSRQLSRLLRVAWLSLFMEELVQEAIDELGAKTYEKVEEKRSCMGVGMSQAARGALGHWVVIEEEKIANYQIISPTTWNASPRDRFGQPGPFEKALMGQKIKDVSNPIELGHIIRSFDPCLVCTVHHLEGRLRC
jgi:hydrogenase large subunit